MHFSRSFVINAILLIKVASSCSSPANDYVLSLNSDTGDWRVQNSNESVNVKATVPGGIYSDLMKSNIIDDIFYRDNDVKSRWVAYDSWIYTRKFTVPNNVLRKNTINLVLHGIDTIANITLNNKLIGRTDNMFVKYQFDIKPYITKGENILQIYFYSPVKEAYRLSDIEMIPPACVPDEYHGECHANQLRKMQASFSWDWGPAFPSVGIWKPINIEAYNSAVISYVTTNMILNESENMWYVNIGVHLDTSTSVEKLEGHLIATLEINNNSTITVYKFIQEKPNKTMICDISMMISVAQISMWWPNGYGEQKLYSLKVSFQSTQFVDEYHIKDMKVGFRTIKLIQDPIENEEGLTFYFKINNYPLFMKGSNWIPMHVLPELSYDEAHVKYLLESTKITHSNMLRVWGGGVYESDYFYEKCDELGILVWQDFMFACAMYPVNEDFLSSVSKEISHVVLHLQHHTSIALWAGNNENEAALRGNWYGTGHDFEHYKEEYVQLYVDVMRPIVNKNDPTRDYLVSSPTNGLQSEKEGYVAKNPYDPHYGDIHYYNYLQDLWSMDVYQETRFSSEYGFQSIPSTDTFKKATNISEDLQSLGDFMIHRQHLPNGYPIIISQLERHFELPSIDNPDYFNTLIYYSQINQAMAMKVESEFYRQSRYDWMTMGALYWQLNDIWQAPSWSGIEFTGKWKMFHYFVKDFFSPILISPRIYVTNEISIFIINDNIQPIKNATMTIDTFKWNSIKPILTVHSNVNAKGLSVEKYNSYIDVPRNETQKAELFYRFSLKNERNEHLSPFNYIFPVHIKDIKGYKKPNINIKFVNKIQNQNNKYTYDIQLSTDGIGLFVWLEIPHSLGTFSENGLILTEETKKITLYSNIPINEKDFKSVVKIQCIQ